MGEKAAEARKESVWKTINREKKRRKRICAEIDMGKWTEYFMRLLGGVKH